MIYFGQPVYRLARVCGCVCSEYILHQQHCSRKQVREQVLKSWTWQTVPEQHPCSCCRFLQACRLSKYFTEFAAKQSLGLRLLYITTASAGGVQPGKALLQVKLSPLILIPMFVYGWA